jgi:sRNA-binding carbon storage regulator CsrA
MDGVHRAPRDVPLVIARRPDEQLVLMTPDGYRIVIEAEPMKGRNTGATRLAVTAPREVVIVRAELEVGSTAF